MPPTILYAFPKYDDDAKQEIARQIEVGEVVKAKPRKPKDDAESSEGEDAAGDGEETAAANDPDTDAATELAAIIVAALDGDTRKRINGHPGFDSVVLHTILKKTILNFGN
jgi:hypothetical protein